MALFKTRKQREEEKAAAEAAAQKKKVGIKEKLSHVKVSDTIAVAGAAIALVGTGCSTYSAVRSIVKPKKRLVDMVKDEALEWLLDIPGITPDTDITPLLKRCPCLKGASYPMRTEVRYLIKDEFKSMARAQEEFIQKHTLDESTKTTKNNCRNENRGRK